MSGMPLLMLWLRREARLRWPALLACTIETPVVLVGRLADPARPDEAVVTPAFVRSTGRGVGDTVTARLTTPAQASASVNTGLDAKPAGPTVRLRIVGVIRSLWYGDDIGGRGSLIPSAGLFARYRANFLGAAGEVPLNAIIRLRGGGPACPRSAPTWPA